MKIIKEDPYTLIFEDNPSMTADRTSITITFILIFLAFLSDLFSRVIIVNTIFLVISKFLIVATLLLFIILCIFIFGKLYTVRVRIDRKSNIVSISNHVSGISWFSGVMNPTEIPLQLINNIEYHPWSPRVFDIPSFPGFISKLVFILKDNTKVDFFTSPLLNNVKLGRKIADYMNIRFEII
jgi:hypothetical protein